MSKKFVHRLIERKDYDLLWFWYNEYNLFFDQNDKKITKRKFIEILKLLRINKNFFLVIFLF